MGDLVRLALQRKLAAALTAGDVDKAERYRARLAGPAKAPEPAAVEPEPEVAAPEAPSLEGVEFASPEARSAAEDAGLDFVAFYDRRQSGVTGFTKADVERIAGGEAD